MGKLTVFVKDKCLYCDKLLVLLNRIVKRIENEVKLDNLCKIQKINIKDNPQHSALCIRLTGSFTVPQVFLNSTYIGDASYFNCCVNKDTQNVDTMKIEEQCEKLFKTIRSTLLEEVKNKTYHEVINFPPALKAKMVKVTDNLAFTSLPTIKQLKNLKTFGFETIYNLITPNSPAFDNKYQTIAEENNIKYYHLPLYTLTYDNITVLLDKILQNELKTPSLIFDETGQIAGLIVLFLAIKLYIKQNSLITLIELEKLFKTWLIDLNIDILTFISDVNLISNVLLRLKS